MKAIHTTPNSSPKRLPPLAAALLLLPLALAAQPTNNPVAAYYGAGNYPTWVDGLQWATVIDMSTYANGAGNFEKFENARDELHAAGGGVMYYPAGTYVFDLPDLGYGPGIGPMSRGLMLKSGVVIRGADLVPGADQAVVRASSDSTQPGFYNNVTHTLSPQTVFVFPTQVRGTDPVTLDANSAGEVPSHWSFIGMTLGSGEATIADIDNIGVVNVKLEGGTIFWGYHTPRAATRATGLWLSAFKTNWPAFAPYAQTWGGSVPDGTHYMDAINGSTGWHTEVSAGSGRLVFGVLIENGAPFNDMVNLDNKATATTACAPEAFAHYRYTGRIAAHGSNIFIANNVIAKPTRNFVHRLKQNVGDRNVLFDYGNHIGIDVNKSNYGGNQNHPSVTSEGSGYYCRNVMVRDNWVFNRGNKAYEISGMWAVVRNNHSERYYCGRVFPAGYITNPEVYLVPPPVPQAVAVAPSGADMEVSFSSASSGAYQLEVSTDGLANWNAAGDAVAGTGGPLEITHAGGTPLPGNSVFYRVDAGISPSATIDAGGISFEGWGWQTSETASDYMSRGYDLGGRNTWIDHNSVINTGSIGNDGEGVMAQRHNNIETFSWAFTRNVQSNVSKGPGTYGESGWIGIYDMHAAGLLLLENATPGAHGLLKVDANWVLDTAVTPNEGPGGTSTPATTHAAGSDYQPVHTDPVNQPLNVQAVYIDGGTAVQVTWDDNAANELGFRIDRQIDGGAWQTIAYRPAQSLGQTSGVLYAPPDPDLAYPAMNPEMWVDYTLGSGVPVAYRVTAINANDDGAGPVASLP